MSAKSASTKVENRTEDTRTTHEIDVLVERARKALDQYMSLTQEDVDRIVLKASVAGLHQHGHLAQMAVAETGRGVFEDKATKNISACEHVPNSMANLKTVGSSVATSSRASSRSPSPSASCAP